MHTDPALHAHALHAYKADPLYKHSTQNFYIYCYSKCHMDCFLCGRLWSSSDHNNYTRTYHTDSALLVHSTASHTRQTTFLASSPGPSPPPKGGAWERGCNTPKGTTLACINRFQTFRDNQPENLSTGIRENTPPLGLNDN